MAQVASGIAKGAKSMAKIKGIANWKVWTISFIVWMLEYYAYWIINGKFGSYLIGMIDVPIISIFSAVPLIGGAMSGIMLAVVAVLDLFTTVFIVKIVSALIVYIANLSRWLAQRNQNEAIAILLIIAGVIVFAYLYYIYLGL